MLKSNILSLKSMLPSGLNTQLATKATFVGIDFGTSTTVVSIATKESGEEKIKTLPIKLTQILEDGTIYQSEKLPSVIAWYNGRLLVGEGASNLKYTLTKGKNIWFSFKMEIGEDLGAKYYNSEVGDMEGVKIRNPKDCVRVFFMYLNILIKKYCQDNGLSDNIMYAVSIPASFEANQRKELMEALESNGMNISKQSLIDEPNAAFISYVHDSEESEKPLLISPHYNSNVLVFDFGGGTCDISILEIGKSTNGLYSKNIAISKFTKLGGDDVDRYITFKYILPRFFEANNVSDDDFITKERQYIATQLYKVSERLKILLCKKISNQMYQLEIPDYIKSNSDKASITIPVSVETKKGLLTQSEFFLSIKELVEVMSVFMKSSLIPSSIKGQEEYNNIFMPIESAIKKANVCKSEIDYVLLIGGSAQNPFIQEALKKYFDDSEILVPQDLQTHVSKGAAIHSLLMNGINKCIIQPITSEPIFVITKDTTNKVLIPAGTTIPCDTVVIDDLIPTKDHQEAIELPICVGNENKMLFNLKITRDGGFLTTAQVTLALEITADKLLLAKAHCMGVSCMVEPQNPFANKELSTEERIVLRAEREANIETERNGGIPTKNCLISLRKAYEDAGNDFKAAETLEQQNEIYPNPEEYNLIGVYYHNSGNRDKAIDFFERALDHNPNDYWANFNLGNTLFYRDLKRARQYLNKAYELNPFEPCINILLGRLDKREGKESEAKEKFQIAYDKYEQKWKANLFYNSDYGWFASVAEELGKKDKAYEIRSAKPKIEQTTYYDEENLTQTRTKSLTIL
ncbi:Hsp70 family protein [Leyella stercorea]|uniref:Tetratricopeptide repeat protein n=1 Tax=Leyella stercorea TaxID=363265 RepID=A0A3R6FKP1_9BACT|nr:Hsp70 family protein [Leyella stercorea]RHK51033.1 tetratricopeptide repeat protein [Leyella stercorea]